MANSKSTPQDLIRDSFSPQIGVLCSANADQTCTKNNLNFVDLLQPFCRLNTELQYKDPNGANVSVRNLKISLVDINTKPPHPTLARKYLNASVSDANIPRFQLESTGGEYAVHIPSSAPWFEAWRDTFFQVQYPADHEFTKHFLACMLVVSSNDANPLDALVTLTQTLNHMQNISITKLPKWFNNNVLRYYVMLHEETGTTCGGSSPSVFEEMQQIYGAANCFLLHTNSRVPSSSSSGEQLPDPWSQFLNKRIIVSAKSMLAEDVSPVQNRSSSGGGGGQLQESLEIGQEAEAVVAEVAMLTTTYHPLSPSDDQHPAEFGQLHGEEQQPMAEAAAAAAVLHGACLSTEDVEQIKLLVHEFCTRALVPYIERQVHQLSDQVSNKKGVISKSLFSATKRWFSPNKPTSNSATINTLTYPPDAAELHIRRLGDLYFMFGHYTMAYHAYHTAKRDFIGDQAWLYYAGALEMAALAAFMANESSRKSFDYMEESISTYLTTCRMPQFAARATLLSAECLKGYQLHGEAAHQLIRMTSEDSDLRSALLLEQASYCFLASNAKPVLPMVRKYAFHMVLAGHRFSKASQRKHSLRCYKQAYQIYANTGWNLAQDHIHYTIGRQANSLHELEEAVQSYAKLLTGDSKQSCEQQALFLKEYLTVHSSLLKKQNSLLTQVLPLPLVNSDSIRVLVGPAAPLRTPGKVPALGITLSTAILPPTSSQQPDEEQLPAVDQRRRHALSALQKWNKLEEMLVQEAQGSLPLTFKPLLTLFTCNSNNNLVHPIAVIGEPIQVSVQLINPLQILLNLKDIYLLWQYRDTNDQLIAANDDDAASVTATDLRSIMKTHIIKSAILQSSTGSSSANQEMILSVTPLAVGQVSLKGICYTLISNGSVEQVELIEQQLRGKQLFCNEGDQRRLLDIKVVPSAPCLQVSFSEMNSELLRNELQQISVELRNIGSVPLHKIYMATSMPHLLSSCEFQPAAAAATSAADHKPKHRKTGAHEDATAREKRARKNHVSYLPLAANELEPGQHHNVTIWLKAPELIGPASIDLLIYYENVDASSTPRYRLVRHVWQLSIQESIQVDLAKCQQSCDAKRVEKLTFTLKATNLNKIHHAILTEISILKAALIAPDWLLSNDVVAPSVLKLESQESVYICLKAIRRRRRGFPHNSHYSEVSLMQQQPVAAPSSNSAIAYLDFAHRDQRNMLNIFDPPDAAAGNDDATTLILRWQAFITDSLGRKRSVYGQNRVPISIQSIGEEEAVAAFVPVPPPPPQQLQQLPPLDIELSISAINETIAPICLFDKRLSISSAASSQLAALSGYQLQQQQELHKLVYYHLVHPHAVYHDFQSSKLCVVSLDLLVHNSVEDDLMFKIETDGTSTCCNGQPQQHSSARRRNALFYPHSSSQFRWIQKGSVVRHISPLKTAQIRLSVAVLAPGTFDLGSRIEIWCYKRQDHPETAVLQSYRVQSSLIVSKTATQH